MTTDSGYVITADLNDFTLTGTGLTGSGTFLVTSGGAVNGTGLTTLAGWGTFTSAGQPAGTWRLVEHLKIT